MNPEDSSLTLVIEGGLLSTLGHLGPATGLGLNHLLSGVRATTGVVAGRYFYEVRLVDVYKDGARSIVRMGFGSAALSWGVDLEGRAWNENNGQMTKPHSKQIK